MNDFGRSVDVPHRYDDFAKLHECLSTVVGASLAPLPPKNMFGGNDPKVVEERRPMLEKLVRECVSNERVLSDKNDVFFKFLEIPPSGVSVIKFLNPSTRIEQISKLPELIQGDPGSENYRLFTEPVLRVLLAVVQSSHAETSAKITCLDVLQYVLSGAHAHPQASVVDVQQLFVQLGGMSILWTLLVDSEHLRDKCRRVLSALITSNSSNGTIEKYECLMHQFLADQDGLSVLFSSSADPAIHEIMAKLVWFGLSESVQRKIANHAQGLSLLGRLYSSPDANARTLSGLTLSVLITSGLIAGPKLERAVQGVASILSSMTESTLLKKNQQSFLSSLCRGSPNGLSRILRSIKQEASATPISPMADLSSLVVVEAELDAEVIDRFGIESVMETALLENESQSVVGMSAARFLFRLYSLPERLPIARSDGKITVLLAKVQAGIAEFYKTSNRQLHEQHKEISQFSSQTLAGQVKLIQARQTQQIDFSQLESLSHQYEANRVSLSECMRLNSEAIADLGRAATTEHRAWTSVPADILKEWNQSSLGMGKVRKQMESLKQQLGDKESASKCAEADSENLQQVVSKMREEIMKVDANAEEFRKESSRFSAAASGAVDPELMLQRASEAEANAKAEIGKREALRQSQDSLETQLENVRKITVKAETDANTIRKALAETNTALDQGEKLHKDLQDRFSAELGKHLSQWSNALKSSSDNMDALALILQRFDQINSMILTEKEQKGLLRNVIGDLVNKLQHLQTNLAAE